QDLQLGGELVANRQPERAGGLEDPRDLAAPGEAPVEVGPGVAAVVVDIIIIADVEGRIGENQVDRAVPQPREQLQAIAIVEAIESQRVGRRHGTAQSSAVGGAGTPASGRGWSWPWSWSGSSPLPSEPRPSPLSGPAAPGG